MLTDGIRLCGCLSLLAYFYLLSGEKAVFLFSAVNGLQWLYTVKIAV